MRTLARRPGRSRQATMPERHHGLADARSVATYPLGPTVDTQVDSGRTYTDIIKSAGRPNPNIDKLLSGFNDWLSAKPGAYIQHGLASLGK
jgi:hypothetical protein